jgi:two-component system nitrate/nitrite response regulator NarL
MTDPIEVALIDDHRLCQSGLAELLEHSGGFHVVGRAGNPAQAHALVREHTPALLVMDLRMPEMDGITLLQELRAAGHDIPTMILTMSDTMDDLALALGAGVRGYILKDMEPADIVESIRRAARGELVVAPAMAIKLAHLLQTDHSGQSGARAARLTEREREILQHVAAGKSNKAIAKSLEISHDTVKLHVRHILAKLKLTSRVEAAVYAVEHRNGVNGRPAF